MPGPLTKTPMIAGCGEPARAPVNVKTQGPPLGPLTETLPGPTPGRLTSSFWTITAAAPAGIGFVFSLKVGKARVKVPFSAPSEIVWVPTSAASLTVIWFASVSAYVRLHLRGGGIEGNRSGGCART